MHKHQRSYTRLNASSRSVSTRLHDKEILSEALSEPSLMEVEDVPRVFNRAAMSKRVLMDYRSECVQEQCRAPEEVGMPEQGQRAPVKRAIEGINQIHHLVDAIDDDILVDEDCLSLESLDPEGSNNELIDFDKRKRTPLERVFAVDKDVRHGQLTKHLRSGKTVSNKIDNDSAEETDLRIGGPRSLVIEGAALKHLFGDAVSRCV